MNERCSISLGLTPQEEKAGDKTVLHYRKCSRLSKGKSLLIYMLQSVVCFLLLGPIISVFLSQLWEYFGNMNRSNSLQPEKFC